MGLGDRIFLFVQAHNIQLALVAVLGVLILAIWNLRLGLRLRRLAGERNASVGDPKGMESLRECLAEIERLAKTTEQLETESSRIEGLQRTAVQNVGVVRFDAFDDVGGGQSFAVALLDAQANGLVLSSLFGRSESRLYAKPVSGGKSEHVLSKEEQEAIRKALRS